MAETFTTPQGRRLAYLRQPGNGTGGGPGVVFLHGYNSDMEGTKAEVLADWSKDAGRAFLRFDLSGHGQSDGTLGQFGPTDWAEDVAAILDALTDGPQVLVGSSLGGWLALSAARSRPDRVAAVVTIAAAPDFTLRMEGGFSPADREQLARAGHVTRPSPYGADYVYSARLFAQGRAQALLDRPLHLPMPVRMLQGTRDDAVPMVDALALLDHATGPDIRLTLVRDADHRFSDPACLALVRDTVAGLVDG